jgi:starch synthase
MGLKVLLAAAECAPFVKVGGLADVIGSLPKALAELGVDVRVVIPLYGEIRNSKFEAPNKSQILNSKFKTDFGGTEEVGVYEAKLPDSDVPIYFLENEKYLSGGGIYFSKDAVAGSQEEIKRFAFFSKAVVSFLTSHFPSPTSQLVVHCNDWHTGLVPGLLKTGGLEDRKTDFLDLESLRSRFLDFSSRQGIETSSSRTSRISNFKKSRFPASVFTIHNLANQGFSDLTLLKNFDSITQELELIKWDAEDDNLDLMLQGITAADVLSTVSPTYAKEILTPEFGEGLHRVLKAREGRLFGVLNGIDIRVWNPATDPKIEFNYSLKEGLAGKVANKIYLQKEMDLRVDPEVPLIGMVTRLADQKGFDLILPSLKDILALGAQLVILGVGDEALERELGIKNQELRGGGNFAFVNRFDGELAHKIYAGADLFLMPSKFEPCGLVQLMAMRYGALPIVRKTGGLADTVVDGETGFVFEEYSAEALLEAVERAVGRFGVENIHFRQMIARAMRQDFSWNRSAREYLQLYQKAVEYKQEQVSINQ